MGRGGSGENGLGEMRAAGAATQTEIRYELQLLQSAGLISPGELVHLAGGQAVELQDGDPTLAMRGLAQVEGVELQSDGSYMVTFADGRTALVDLEEGGVAFPDGTESQTLTAGALYAALGARASGAPVDFDPKAASLYSDLAAARARLLDYPNNPDAFRAFAQAAVRAGDQILPGQIGVNEDDLTRRAEGAPMPTEEERNCGMAANLQRARSLVKRALQGPEPDEAALGLLYQVNEDNEVVLPEQEFAERAEAASRLSGGADPSVLIPESNIKLEPELDEDGNPTGQFVSVGPYYLGLEEQAKMQSMRYDLDLGTRGFIFRGPPGSGKDAFVKEFAALSRRPYKAFNLGGRTDLTQIKGGDSLEPQEVFEERWEEVRDAKGKVKRDKDGEPVMEKKLAKVGVIPVTGEQVGELVKWMKEPSCVVIQEPEGQEEDLVQLHSAIGDNLGDPNRRFVMIDSSSGSTHRVHPDCTIFITYNDREGQAKIPDATQDRTLNMDFEYPPVEQEAERMAQIVTGMLKSNTSHPGLDREYTADELKPMVLVAQEARKAAVEGSVEMGELGARQTARAYCRLLMHGYDQSEDPVTAMCENLTFLYDRKEYSADERLQMLRDTIIADQHGRLHDIARAAEKVAAENIGE